MAAQLKQMNGEEFVRKLLAGEKDLSRIELKDGFNLNDTGAFEELGRYLRTQNLRESPIIIDNSNFNGLIARGLYLPFLRGAGANLARADLAGAYLTDADLAGARLAGADLAGARLTRARLRGAYLTGANLAGADLAGAYLTDACLAVADLAGANLTEAYLAGANLTEARLTRARLRGAYLTGANLARANLAGAQNLDKAFNLESAVLDRTKIDRTQKPILDAALAKRKPYIVIVQD